MKTYELIKAQTFGSGREGFLKYIVEPDPKREGLYKSSVIQIVGGESNKFSHLYGKCNQSEIQKLIAISTEV